MPISGGHPIMMEKSALAGVGRYTLPLFHLYPLYVFCGQDERHKKYEVSSYVKAKLEEQ